MSQSLNDSIIHFLEVHNLHINRLADDVRLLWVGLQCVSRGVVDPQSSAFADINYVTIRNRFDRRNVSIIRRRNNGTGGRVRDAKTSALFTAGNLDVGAGVGTDE